MILSTLDMGTQNDPNKNPVVNNDFAALMLRNVSKTMAVGNPWVRGVDGINTGDQCMADVLLSVSAESCPQRSSSGNLDKAHCTGNRSLLLDANFQNIVLSNESYSDTPDGGLPPVIFQE